jgi:GT2 family glycosyltransferase
VNLLARVGVVAIGRNEGERLRRCLESLRASVLPIVYVDSGSTDNSVELAQSLGAEVVTLDLSMPFTAARARNEGFQRLLARAPEVEFVQFVDGDCEVAPGWMETAVRVLDERPEVVVVCGRRRERFPETSIYNRLCDLEWDTPVGDAEACGGDAFMRVSAFMAVGGYREIIAGEEPELCVRLRERGGKILRLDAEMTLHDAAMTRFRQWWKRNVRAGHAFAEVARLHRHRPFGIWQREVRSNWFWSVVLLLCPLASIYLYFKIKRGRLRRGDDAKTARLYARYCVLSKFPQVWGQFTYHWNRLLGRRQRLIEYKEAPTA